MFNPEDIPTLIVILVQFNILTGIQLFLSVALFFFQGFFNIIRIMMIYHHY